MRYTYLVFAFIFIMIVSTVISLSVSTINIFINLAKGYIFTINRFKQKVYEDSI